MASTYKRFWRILGRQWIYAASISTATGAGIKLHNDGKKVFPKNIDTVIFDFDGTIADTETIYQRVNEECMKKFNAPYTSELHHGQMGQPLTKGVEFMLVGSGLKQKGVTIESYLDCYNRTLKNQMKQTPQIQLMPGARKLIEHLQKNKVQTGICTSSGSEDFRRKIACCRDLVQKMDVVVTAGDDPEVRKGKPEPYPYLVTADRLPKPVPPERIIVFEDSEAGVRSALAAGHYVIWLPEHKFMTEKMVRDARELKRKNPRLVEILVSLEHFDPARYGLPPYEDWNPYWLYALGDE